MIDVKEIDFVYPDGTYAIKKLSMSLEKGKKIAIVGPNGAGKTTLFLNLNGVHKPTSGKVYFQGKEVTYKKKEISDIRKKVGIVFQDPNTQLFSANVFQEVSFGPMNLGLSREEVKDRVQKALRKTNVENIKDKPTHFLSGGQKKRVAIADILAMDPMVIFLDEPTAFVDPKTSNELMKFFDQLHREGRTVVLSTHDMDKVYSWADYVYVMKDGTMIGQGTPQKIFTNDQILKDGDLNKPWILEFYEDLLERKPQLKGERIPKNKEELLCLISKS